MKVYGIKNCDTVKKTLNWLDQHSVSYEFHDFKKLGVSEEKLRDWSGVTGYEALLNKRGTTWKKLDEETQRSIISAQKAYQLMQEKPSVIKRPVIESGGKLILGFDPDRLEKLL